MSRTPVILAAILGSLAVLAGTFGAHGLDSRLSVKDLDLWDTATRYHMYHALAILGVASLDERRCRAAAWLFAAGVVVFSGSLYALALSEWATGRRLGWLGMITPIGGVSLIAGWVALLAAAIPCSTAKGAADGHDRRA